MIGVGLCSRPRGPIRTISCAASVLAVVLTVPGCTAVANVPSEPGTEASEESSAIGQHERRAIAAALVAQLPCPSMDELQDDLQVWDRMSGFDCLSNTDPSNPTDSTQDAFVRVYSHRTTVEQVLEDWAPTLTNGRSVVRGPNWFVIGPTRLTQRLQEPDGQPVIADDPGSPVPPTRSQEYRTMCVRFLGQMALSRVNGERIDTADIHSLDTLFPGARRAMLSATAPVIADVRSEPDQDRRAARLSRIGPALKKACARAERRTQDVRIDEGAA